MHKLKLGARFGFCDILTFCARNSRRKRTQRYTFCKENFYILDELVNLGFMWIVILLNRGRNNGR